MTSNLQELRKLIIKANYPDTYNGWGYGSAISQMYPEYDFVSFDKNGDLQTYDECDEDWYYVETKPLTLAMVLIALAECNRVRWVKGYQQRSLFLEGSGELYLQDDIYWNLTKDLDNQQPEVIDQLLTLIKNEND